MNSLPSLVAIAAAAFADLVPYDYVVNESRNHVFAR